MRRDATDRRHFLRAAGGCFALFGGTAAVQLACVAYARSRREGELVEAAMLLLAAKAAGELRDLPAAGDDIRA